MSNINDIGGGGNTFNDPGLWTCRYDGIEFYDEHVYAQHMLMAHNEIVPVGGVVPVNPVTPPTPTPVFIPPEDPGPWPQPVPDPVVFTPVEPVYIPTPLIPTTPVPVTTGTGNGASYSVGALLLVLGGVLALGRNVRRRKVAKRG